MNLETDMDLALSRLDALVSAATIWTVAPAILLVVLLFVLILLARMRSRSLKAEAWLAGELDQLRRQLDALQRAIPPPRPARPVPPPPQHVPREPAPSAPQATDLTPLVNDLLAGNQPYNFVEAVRAMDPRLALQRLTPRASQDAFTKEVILENGGDGLFACIEGETALLYPNYSRFSATLDPQPLFDGARHGGRIQAVQAPAILTKKENGAWLLTQRGRVQMR